MKKTTEPKPASGNGKIILVAEDEESSIRYLQAILSRENYTLLTAANGIEAVKIFRETPGIALVLMDMKMPVMDGFEATRLIKKINPGIPVIAQTAYALPGDREEALEAGCNDYIAKPVKRLLLLELIKKYI